MYQQVQVSAHNYYHYSLKYFEFWLVLKSFYYLYLRVFEEYHLFKNKMLILA